MKKWDVLLALVGVALFAFAADRIGWGVIVHAIEHARIAVAIIIALSLIRLLLQTCSWSIALRSGGIKTSAGNLMLIRLASQGIGYLSVLGPVASEPMKINLLRKPGGLGTAPTLVDTGVYWFTSGLVGIAGCLAATVLLAHSRHPVASLAVAGVILTTGLFLIARPKSRLSPLADALGDRCPRWLEKGRQIEVALRQFGDRYPSSIRRMLLLGIACQLLLGAEVVAVLWSLRIPFHATTVLGIEGASRAIKIMGAWMPARIGADESGFAGAFFAFGLSPASGLTLALARRSRDLLAALVGLSWLALSAGFLRLSADRSRLAIYSKKEEIECKAL